MPTHDAEVSSMNNLWVVLYHFLKQRKGVFWLLLCCTTVLFAWFGSQNRFTDNIEQIFPDNKSVKHTQSLLQQLNFANKYTLVIENADTVADPDLLINTIVGLEQKINTRFTEKEVSLQTTVADNDIQAALTFVPQHLPLYLTDSDYQKLNGYVQSDSLLQQKITDDYEKLTALTGAGYKSIIAQDPLGLSGRTLSSLSRLNFNDSIELYQQYIFDKDHRSLLAFVYIHDPVKAKQIVDFIQSASSDLTHQNQQLHGYFLGAEVFAKSNADQIKSDINLVLLITISLLVVLLIVAYRNAFAPMLLLSPVVYGLLFAGFVNYFFRGSTSIVALGAVSIIIGIAVNYSLHYFSHLRHHQSVEDTIKELWQPLTIGSFTTVAALFSLLFTTSPILQDFGFIGGFALMGAAFFTLVFLPHFIRPAATVSQLDIVFKKINNLFRLSAKQSAVAVVIIVIMTVFFATQMHKVRFAEDMNSFNFMNEATHTTVEKTDRLLANKTHKKIFLAVKDTDPATLLKKQHALTATLDTLMQIGQIQSHSSIGDLVIDTETQQTRIHRWNDFWAKHDRSAFIARIKKAADAAGFSEDAFVGFYAVLQNETQTLPIADFSPLTDFGNRQLWVKKDSMYILLTAVAVSKDALSGFFDRLSASDGVAILDKAFLTRQLVTDLKNNFNYVLIVSSLVVSMALYLAYGRLELAILAFLPMTISWVWIVGIMGLFGIHFNLINIIISTFIFGIGDDFSIFTVDALLDDYKSGKKVLSVSRESIFLSLVTTLLGMGALIFAKHPALQSVALISIIGVLTVFVLSQLLQPIIVQLFLLKRKESRLPPYTLLGFLRSVFAFFYFVFGAFLLTFLGFITFYLLPISKAKRKYGFHFILSKFVKSLVYIMFNTKKVFIDRHNLNFDEPSVIIANHQSFLDILITVMLHPKLILLTNDWVWNSPVFGRVVKMADYYPVFNGAEDGLEKFEKITQEGYSIVVFPEGTRSADGVIKRFHKGAFYIAEKLNLPIRPIVLHGICDTMRKGDFQLMNGTMTLKCLPPIYPTDTAYGVNYSERTKNISSYFKAVYADLKNEYESPRYFADVVEHAYLFKGPVLEWYTKVKMKIEGYYERYDALLPKSGVIVDVGCGYGYMTYLLHLASPQRQFVSIDFDAEKIAVAAHCFLKNDCTTFVAADIAHYSLPSADAFIFNDVLHYLTRENQRKVVNHAMTMLQKNGIIIIKDGNAAHASKHGITKFTEFISTKIGFNDATYEQLEFVPEHFWQQIADENHFSVTTIEQSKYTSNYYLVLKRKNETI